ncbi:MFS transporter [Nocardia arthritidis]|uniref:MFS transporter n=1 Tax=Nocardia arthritidis TaxID=228602 RepID=A0A6G9YE17_9NOCA|nr:MFS transporter [Nocardia arthritidis]QIS11525.1 MFS transporter [Nocardia arthritidis]
MRWGATNVLRDRNARLYLGGVIVSGFGDTAMMLAAGIWVKTLTGSNSLAALVGFCVWAPTIAGPVLGIVADRVPRRRLLVGTNLALAVVMTALLTVRTSGHVWLLFAVLLVVGIGMVITDAAETALVATAIAPELRGDFNGLVRTAIESMKLVAPLAGAALFTTIGGPAVALVDAVTFMMAAAAFRLLRVPRHNPTVRTRRWRTSESAGIRLRDRRVRPRTRTRWTADTADGIRYLWRQPESRAIVVSAGFAIMLASLSSTATYAMLDSGLHQSPAFAGVLMPVQGMGSIVSGLAAGALMRRTSERSFATAGLVVFALGVLARATPWLPVVLGGSLLIGLGLPCPLVAAMTVIQQRTPHALLGRVGATANTIMFAPNGFALLGGSALVAVLDYRMQTITAGLLALTIATLLARTTTRRNTTTAAISTSDIDVV